MLLDNWIIDIKGERTQRTTTRACATVHSGVHEIFNKTSKRYIFKNIFFYTKCILLQLYNFFLYFPSDLKNH